MRQPGHESGCCDVVFAEQQTAGRGRHGRQWVSPFAGNLYFSIRYQFDTAPSNITGLSLAVGVAIVDFLKKNHVNAALKWPNDILVNGRKLCGILLEMRGESHGPYEVVIGVGLNLNMPASQAEQIDQPWIALNQVCDLGLSRNELAAALLIQILSALKEFESHGLEPFRERWMMWDSYLNTEVRLRLGDKEIHGIEKGIDQQGALLLEMTGKKDLGQLRRFYSGEISLRQAK
jgi:BirA family biotin operon repressor/biotin-[acetyl-CoA-carboxylase] ligase